MPNLTRLHAALLRVTLSLSCWIQVYHAVAAMDVIIQDTNPSIVYQPATSWFSSSQLCSTCLDPGVSTSYHEAVNNADQDDLPNSIDSDANSTSISSLAPSSSSNAAPIFTPAPSPNFQVGTGTNPLSSPDSASQTPKPRTVTSSATATKSTEDSGNSNKGPGSSSSSPGSSGSTPGSSGDRRRNLLSRADSDELNITLSFNFTGTTISLYGIQPQGFISGSTGTPANMNLSFTLDGMSVGSFSHLGSEGPDGSQGASTSPIYVSNVAVFSKDALEDVPHQLVVHVGENSTFIFDYLVYSTNTTTNSSSTPTIPLAQTTPSPSADPKVKKHNIATFGGVVGGGVGLLALFSLGLALSIIRRRRLAAARDRHDNESHPNAPDDSPHMSGPAPFVPRFFPDTVIPTEPPTYMVALATNGNNSTLLSSLTSSPYPATTRSYADIPPSTPPPLEDAPLIPPPPPFPGMRPPKIPVGALPPSIPGQSQRSHTSDLVGTNHSNSDPKPELVPLLLQRTETQSIRSPSKASSRSYDINGNPLDDDSDDDS